MARTVDPWTDATHLDLTDLAALRMGLSRAQQGVLHRYVMVPDQWGLLDKIRHYMPLCAFFAGELTRDAIFAAKDASSEECGLVKLAYGMHFLQDAGNPWHALPLLPRYQKNHSVYEDYVARNMQEGFRFHRALMKTPDCGIMRSRFTRRIGEGTAQLARQAVQHFPFLDKRIRTDPAWQECDEVARVTLSLLSACLQMCETQIHSFSIRAEVQAVRPIRLPVAVTWTFLGSDKRRLTT
ncbi:hypothetical protein [Methanoregula sp.]|uniref:hypothetical protein n=1 Tax=Methanoregula sp. TaxID=2052170 RepID=UPI002C07AAB8|nr:hypothetical protein [Methanoregula sp.]HVP97007.1 hypothetical protein [Methanoregula sp.]